MAKKIIFVFTLFFTWQVFALGINVVSVTGRAEIQEAGNWIPLEIGAVVEKGSIISTGFKSQVVLEVKSSQFTLGPLTRISVENLISDSEKDVTQLFMDTGSVSAKVSSESGKRTGFKVRSPVATASVRGTSFSFTSSGKLSVDEGLVSFGPAESSSAEISEDIAENETGAVADATTGDTTGGSSDTSSGDGASGGVATETEHANVHTPTRAVGGNYGVPVGKGQTSKANAITGSRSNPVSEKTIAASGSKGSTATLTSKESVGTSTSASTNTTSTVTTSSKDVGSVVVKIEL